MLGMSRSSGRLERACPADAGLPTAKQIFLLRMTAVGGGEIEPDARRLRRRAERGEIVDKEGPDQERARESGALGRGQIRW